MLAPRRWWSILGSGAVNVCWPSGASGRQDVGPDEVVGVLADLFAWRLELEQVVAISVATKAARNARIVFALFDVDPSSISEDGEFVQLRSESVVGPIEVDGECLQSFGAQFDVAPKRRFALFNGNRFPINFDVADLFAHLFGHKLNLELLGQIHLDHLATLANLCAEHHEIGLRRAVLGDELEAAVAHQWHLVGVLVEGGDSSVADETAHRTGAALHLLVEGGAK